MLSRRVQSFIRMLSSTPPSAPSKRRMKLWHRLASVLNMDRMTDRTQVLSYQTSNLAVSGARPDWCDRLRYQRW